jgi:hypothetical protein
MWRMQKWVDRPTHECQVSHAIFGKGLLPWCDWFKDYESTMERTIEHPYNSCLWMKTKRLKWCDKKNDDYKTHTNKKMKEQFCTNHYLMSQDKEVELVDHLIFVHILRLMMNLDLQCWDKKY